ncbi:peptidylprolyl isomerase [Helicobacter apodemus]|uniref:Peptidylprolyl isomerase n=1 Tax=Helicobacter apodemus TaxID=135569 RepID=A0A2U8FBH6_9HELI|nr:peptidyl-prolyl cis-trans isomerase [Helicobacter apodemus]AWI33590.1 peptidylprolyl isomerase [Helicobacter apodemus]
MKRVVLSSLVTLALLQGIGIAKTFAKVNGEEVTDKDITLLMRAMPGVSFDQLPQEGKEQVINQAIERKLLIEQSKKDKIQNTKEYKEAIANAQDDLMLEVWMRQKLDKIKVSSAEIKSFYDENKAGFIQPDLIKARHILVSSEEDAKRIISDLKKSGTNVLSKFEELAKIKSKDGSAQNGGDLGWFDKNQFIPEFSEAAFKLKKGSYTQTPVKSQFGYHIIYVDDKKPSATLSLKEVEGQIENNLKISKFQDTIKKESDELRKKAKIEISQ